MAKKNSTPAAGAERSAADPCPQCGGSFIVDPTHNSTALIDRKKRNAANPAAAARFADAVTEKVKEHGELHRCATCGYRDRFPVADRAA
jgi:predicted RNA-binding Zn-ribbon protein involved in translation (DUF1610 family)